MFKLLQYIMKSVKKARPDLTLARINKGIYIALLRSDKEQGIRKGRELKDRKWGTFQSFFSGFREISFWNEVLSILTINLLIFFKIKTIPWVVKQITGKLCSVYRWIMSEKFVLSLSFTNDCIATQTLPLNTPFFRVGTLFYYSVSVALCSQGRVCYSTEKSRCL